MWQRIGLALIAVFAMTAKELKISAGLPSACPQAQTLRLTLFDVAFPANTAANIRAFTGPEIYIGMLSLLGSEKPHRIPKAEISASPEFRRWLEETKPASPPPIILRPQGPGRKPVTTDWSVRAAEWSCR